MRRAKIAFACGTLAAAFAPASEAFADTGQNAASVSPPPGPPPSILDGCTATNCRSLTPAQLFQVAEQFARAGRVDDAFKILRLLAKNPIVDIRYEARFRIGILDENLMKWREAATQYRAILDEKPDANPVRLELAKVLAKMGDDDGARSQLRRAASSGLPDDVARIVDQFQQALRSHRRWGGSFESDIAPDSNINHAFSRNTVSVGGYNLVLSNDAQAQSGVGAATSGQLFWRPRLSQNTNFLISLSETSNLYAKSQFNDISGSVGAGPEFLIGKSRLQASALIARRWFGGQVYSDSYGGSFDLLQPLSRKAQLQLDVSMLQNAYLIDPQQTGLTWSSVARLEFAISPRLFGRVSFRVDRQNARVPAFATWNIGGELLLTRDVGPTTIYGRAGFYRLWSDGPFLLPPVSRDDKTVNFEAGIVFRKLAIHGFAPVIRLQHTENLSPVFFYDFKQTRVVCGLTRAF